MNPIEVLIRENIELIGWIASGIILFSFLFDGIKLRLINSVGAVLWLVWGMTMESGSIIFLNGCILFIHIYKILSIKRKVNKTDKNSFLNDLKKFLKKPTRYEF